MKRSLVALVCVLAMVAMITGCSKKKENATATSNVPDTGITLTYWSMWNSTENQAKVIQAAADEYYAETGIKVNIEWKGRDMKTLIGVAMDAGENIDIFEDDYMRMIQNNQKYLLNLSEQPFYAEYSSHVMPIILQTALSEGWGNGSLWCFPYQPYTTGVWYNKALFEKAGITSVPQTWDEFLAVCQKLRDSGVNPLTCNSDTVTLLYGYQLARYIGQDAVTDCLNNVKWAQIPEAKKAAEDLYGLFKAGYFSPYAPANYPDGQNEIGFDESCMILNASWIPNEINQGTGASIDWGFFPWPSVPGGVDGSEAAMVGAQSIGISAKTKYPQEAINFALKLVTGKYDLQMAQQTITIPADVNNTDWPAAISGARPYFDKMTKKYDWAVGLEVNPSYTAILNENLVKLFKMEIDPDQFITALSQMR
ncbi:MAG: extracellular solute-binding protein [Treponema sp.]|nr:extracellular solute-binding protein [Treponema sp.]MDY4673901.1 extracellular solute-binding protein [Treponema sp.]